MVSHTDGSTFALPKSSLNGISFWQRREDIFRRVQQSAEQCRSNYSGRKELATEKDDDVAELCEALEDAFTYGLQQHQSSVAVTAASLFQNMQEIVTGNAGSPSSSSSTNGDNTFWDFCQTHLTPHERERYENLKHVWTKCGRGKAFIRATLNENSLQRYILTWLADEEVLRRYYTGWSLLLDGNMGKQLPEIVGSLNNILFALTVDCIEINTPTRANTTAIVKEEPIIYAPTPLPLSSTKHKRKTSPVERPIATANSTEDLINALREVCVVSTEKPNQKFEPVFECVDDADLPPTDPIEPELEFLKEPLPDYCPVSPVDHHPSNSISLDDASTMAAVVYPDYEDKSDTSSQYSKSSSANCSSSQAALEEKLRQTEERCALLETRVAELSRENRQLVRRLTQHFNELGINPSSSLTTNFLITIPQVKLLKTKRGSSYYTYEIHITMRLHLEHWIVFRRYRDFYKLHTSLLRTHPSVKSVEFPPKKHFGNMNLVFVEERRQQLQIYLLNVVESLPQVEACKTGAELQKVFPFLRER